jgi:hypothetical protein
MLLHMSLHWPEKADFELWPFALEHADYSWNHLPRADTCLAPQELYSGSLFSAMTISLAFIHSVVQCMFSTLPSKMGRRSRSGNLGIGVVNSWATVWITHRLLVLSSTQTMVTLVHNIMWYTMKILPPFPVLIQPRLLTPHPGTPFCRLESSITSWTAWISLASPSLLPRSMTSGSPRNSSVITISSPRAISPSLGGSTLTICLRSHYPSLIGSGLPPQHQVRLCESLARLRVSLVVMMVVVVPLSAIATTPRHGLNLHCLGLNALHQHLSTLSLMMMSLSRATPLVSLSMKA